MKFIQILLLLFFVKTASTQNKYTVSGYIRDKTNGESMVGSTVQVKGTKTAVAANDYGFYSLTLPSGNYDLIFSFTGYTPLSKTIDLKENIKIDIELESTSQLLNEVEIEGEKAGDNVSSVGMSTINMKMETIKKIPALMGEVDIIRAIQLLPGVQNAGEGSTGFFVRGGGVDQNLILLDEATVFNASHLMGFFSVFNQDAIKDAQLYKGGIPARYGGRLSSVLDIHMKEGNSKKLSVSGGIGLISSRLTIEAPIVKDKGSFIISGRRTYADLFLNFSKNESLKNSQLYFYDLNGKLNYKLGDKDKLFVSGYFGRDILSISKAFLLGWGNQTITTRWNHLFTDKLFSNLSLIYSKYDYTLGIPDGVQAFEWKSEITNFSLKDDYTYYWNTNNTLKYGLQSTFMVFNPADFKPLGENDLFIRLKLANKYTLEHGVYISNEQKIGALITLDYGVRWSLFQNLGTDTVYNFNENFDTIPGNGYTAHANGKVYNSYNGWEPRFAFKYSLNESSSIKLSYNRMFQYMHLANNSTSGTPLDIWFPSGTNVKPRISDQVAMGYFKNLMNNKLETSVEVYYKTMKNDLDFKDNAQLIFNKLLEGQIRTGKSWAYGAEFFIRKPKGIVNGWISYTLSKVKREISDINEGRAYNANYDRTHNFALVLSYDINPRLSLGATWTYVTGLPLTAPTGRFEYQGMLVPIYSERNGARLPDYHRGDFSATYYPKREGKKFKDNWNLSVYNAYNRKNAFSITFQDDEANPGQTKAVKTYLFAIVPTITYNFKF